MHERLLATLAPYHQQHLLRFWDELSEAQRVRLAAQIDGIDFAALSQLHWQPKANDANQVLEAQAKPPRAIRLNDPHPSISLQAATACGEAALRAGQVGLILVAGGQGTRLGFDHPKGMFPIGPVSGATLFQMIIEGIRAAARRYKTAIPLYLMTSPATHDETVAHLAEQIRYGLAESDLQIFCQGTMPAVDIATGRVLLAGRDEVALSPDGHGGCLAALSSGGCLADMRRRGLQHIYYVQVDNPLAPICDPAFIGFHLLSQSEMSTLVMSKQAPAEKVGHLIELDGVAMIHEYSDASPAFTERRNTDGSLMFWAGNTAMHLFDVAFLERVSQSALGLPFHLAKKKVSYVDDGGQLIEPSEPNAIKFERFIFDLLPAAKNTLAVEVHAEDAFMPVKNSPAETRDTPQTARAAIVAKHRAWLETAGAIVAQGIAVEISPLFAFDAAECAQKITPGMRIEKPLYFR